MCNIKHAQKWNGVDNLFEVPRKMTMQQFLSNLYLIFISVLNKGTNKQQILVYSGRSV